MRRYPVAVVLLTVFVDLLGFGIVLPILPFYAQRYGASAVQIGAIIAAFSLMQFLFTPVWGRVSDRVGRRPVILVSLFGSVASYLLFARAESVLALLGSRMLAGVAGANLAAAQAYIADVTTPETRARGMGWISAAFGLGYMLGPPIAAVVSLRWGVHAPGYVAAALAFINLVLARLWLPEAAPTADKSLMHRTFDPRVLHRVLKRPVLGGVTFSMTAVALATSGVTAMLALYLQARFAFDAARTAWMFSLIGLTSSAIQLGLVHTLVTRYGERRIAITGIGLLALSLLAIALAPTPAVLRGVLVLYAVGFALTGPSALSLVSRAAAEREQGMVIGVVQSLGALARVVGPMAAGVALGRLGAGAPMVAGSIVCALASVYMWHHLRPKSRTGEVAGPAALPVGD
ncbi:MAG TPA: MFS transporter [Gemmatimonadaceae bacterium]|nr:MFS transporter [Gemmatimonadaceae bacterium]